MTPELRRAILIAEHSELDSVRDALADLRDEKMKPDRFEVLVRLAHPNGAEMVLTAMRDPMIQAAHIDGDWLVRRFTGQTLTGGFAQYRMRAFPSADAALEHVITLLDK